VGSGGVAPHYVEVSGQLQDPALYPRKTAPGTHCIGGCVGPRASMDTVVKRKIPSSCPVEEDYEGQKINGTHQFLLYGDDIHLIDENIRT
jgi:hypothetical protein